MITKFHAQNFKALHDVSLDLTQMHVLIGPNDSGKTSILEAIAAMGRFQLSGDNQNAFIGNWTGRELVWDRGTDTVVLRATSQNRDIEVTCQASFSFADGEQKKVVTPKITFNDEVWDQRPSGQINLGTASQPLTSKLRDLYFEGVTPIAIYRWRPNYLAMPCATHSARGFNLDASGFGLAQVLDALISYSPEAFVYLKDRFRTLFPQFMTSAFKARGRVSKSDQSQAIPTFEQHAGEGKGIYFQFHGHSESFRAARVSDGLLFGLAMLTVLSVPNPPKIILLEEPENGIHPLLLREVFDAIRELLKTHPDTQVIMTTHSPYVVDLMKPEEVTLCQKNNKTGEVRVASLATSALVKEQLGLFTLGELWTMQDDDSKLLDPIADTAQAGSVGEASK